MAPIPADKIYEAIKTMEDDVELTDDGSILALSGELKPGSNDSEDDDNEDSRDDPYYCEKEVSVLTCKLMHFADIRFYVIHHHSQVEATLLSAVDENIQEDHVILEVNSLICVHQCFRC